MPSNVDPAVPVAGTPTTASVRGNFAAVKTEIDALQLLAARFLSNLTIEATRAGNAETIAIKTAAGADPAPSDPITLSFRSATPGASTFDVLTLSAPLSIVVSAGSTLGAEANAPFNLWLVAFNDAGTIRLGVIKCATPGGVFALQDNALASSTAEGGAGAADSAGVFYTGAAVAAKAMRVLGLLEYTLATPGTWDTAPAIVRIHSPGQRLPGELVQCRHTTISARIDAPGPIPIDDTIPQNTEGVEIGTATLAMASAANRVQIAAGAAGTINGSGTAALAVFADATPNAIAASSGSTGGSASFIVSASLMATHQPASVAPVTYKLRAGLNSTSTFQVNGNGAARLYGGAASSYLRVEEIAT